MTHTQSSEIDFPPALQLLAAYWLKKDRKYIEDCAQFGHEPMRSIAQIILAAEETVK